MPPRRSIDAHVNQLITALDTYADGDYPKAYEQIREAYHHMFMTGDALSGAITAQKPDTFTLGPSDAGRVRPSGHARPPARRARRARGVRDAEGLRR